MSNIVVPQLGESVVEARVARWLKKEGDRVEVGEALVALETEKIDLEVSAEQAGVLTSIKHPEGADVKVGEVLAEFEAGAAGKAPQATNDSPKPAKAAAAPASAGATKGDDLRATPTAKRIAAEHDVNLGAVQGTGAAGRVMKQDVQQVLKPAQATFPATPTAPAAAKPAPAPAPVVRRAPGDRTEERTRMTKRRQTIARRLVEAQHTAAMLTTFNEIDMTAVMTLRERRKEEFKKKYGINLGFSSFFVKAAVAALRAFPPINGEIQGDEIILKHYYDVGIAVGAEGGLVVPVLRDADRMGFADIELTIRDFAARAGNGTLTLQDLTGGTFTITNGGVFGSLLSTPILNPPQVGILGLHKIQERPIAVNGQVVIRPMMYVALSYDHRMVDGREAVQFLVKIKEFIEDPGHLLIES
ncbi:MAG: 2-oxoglutarate dehydrogenase complex dihydrolipoyllysine-residue succinyltransferase [Vicinamibacterales bacterium]